MKITKDFLKEKGACLDGFKWFCNQNETDAEIVINKLMKEDKFEWANWVIVRLMAEY